MKLYHGTAAAFLPDILANGIKPRGEHGGTWNDNVEQSHPEMVYMTVSIPFFYALSASAAYDTRNGRGQDLQAKAVVFEVDLCRLPKENLYPDEDSLSQIIPGSRRTKWLQTHFRDNLAQFQPLWPLGMTATGTLAYRGTVPVEAINAYVEYDGRINVPLTRMILDCKPSNGQCLQANAEFDIQLIDWAFRSKPPTWCKLAGLCNDRSCVKANYLRGQ